MWQCQAKRACVLLSRLLDNAKRYDDTLHHEHKWTNVQLVQKRLAHFSVTIYRLFMRLAQSR